MAENKCEKWRPLALKGICECGDRFWRHSEPVREAAYTAENVTDSDRYDDRGPDDYESACEKTPSGYNVTTWMEEMDEQHTTMTAVLRELLAELDRCHDTGAQFDFLSELVTRAYDTVGVIRVTPADLKELGWVAKD